VLHRDINRVLGAGSSEPGARGRNGGQSWTRSEALEQGAPEERLTSGDVSAHSRRVAWFCDAFCA
jgi:hypothetical protein